MAVRINFHIIFFLPKYPKDDYLTCLNLEKLLFDTVLSEWKRNVTDVFIQFRGKTVRDWRHPVWKPCCTYVSKIIRGKVRTNFDLHYVNPRLSDGGTADVGFYVLKYMMKPSDRARRLQQALKLNLSEDEYEEIWSLVKPCMFYSKHFGLAGSGKRKDWKPSSQIVSYLRDSIDKSKLTSYYPEFINPVDGKHFPLSRFYKAKGYVYSIGDALDFYYNDKDSRPDNVVIRDDSEPLLSSSNDAVLAHNVNEIDLKQDSFDFDDLF